MNNQRQLQHEINSQGPANPSDSTSENPNWLRLPGSPKSHPQPFRNQYDAELLGTDRNESDNSNEEKTVRLSEEFSTAFTVFMSALMILTMCLLLYGNTTVGAYVQVQGIMHCIVTIPFQLIHQKNSHSQTTNQWTTSSSQHLHKYVAME